MAKERKTPNSEELQSVLKRIKKSELAADDKAIVTDLLNQTIKLKKLVEKSSVAHGSKKVLASLPFGFDIVK